MILDALSNCSAYANAHPRFQKAFAFLISQPLATLPCGRYDIDGDEIYAMIQEPSLRPQEAAKLESHRKYIDIQYVISGDETMGWSPVEGCGKVTDFDTKKDCGFFSDKPMAWFPVRPGCFALFYPQDAHAPCVGEGTCRKVVIKVLA